MYIDPSSGGMLFQVLLAIFAVLSGTILVFSSRIKMGIAKLKRRFRQTSDDDITTSNDQKKDPS